MNGTPLLDTQVVAEAKTLMPQTFPKLAGYFFEDGELYVSQVETAFAAGLAEDLVPPAHTLKSASRQMGALSLSNAAELVERAARTTISRRGDVADLAPAVTALRSLLEETITAYRALL